MLTILNQRNNKSLSFKNYEQLYKNFTDCEKARRSIDAPQTLRGWTFTRHSYQRVLSFCQYVIRQKREKKGLDVLEICQGEQKPLLIPVTPTTNIAALKKQWCHAYCEAHGFQLEEIPDSSDQGTTTSEISYLDDPQGVCPTLDPKEKDGE